MKKAISTSTFTKVSNADILTGYLRLDTEARKQFYENKRQDLIRWAAENKCKCKTIDCKCNEAVQLPKDRK
jgi:ribosome maturation protein Sdo1